MAKHPSREEAREALERQQGGQGFQGTMPVPVARTTGRELKSILTCLKTRPAKADKTAMFVSLASACATVASVLRAVHAAGAFLFDPVNTFLLCVAGISAYTAWRKYEDTRTAKDPHLNDAIEDVERLMAETAAVTAEVERALALRIAAEDARRSREGTDETDARLLNDARRGQ